MPKHRILMVDDDRDFLLAMRVRLEASGYEVIEASDVNIALVAVEHQPPSDLMLLDIDLTIGNGIMLLDCLRTYDALRKTPAIMNGSTGFRPAPRGSQARRCRLFPETGGQRQAVGGDSVITEQRLDAQKN